MAVVDYILLGVVLVSVIVGVVRGFFKEALSLATWLIAIWAAWQFSYITESLLGGVLAQPEVRLWVGRLIVFLAILMLGGVINWTVALLVQRVGLNGADRVLGMAFGFGRGLVLIGLVVMLGRVLEMPDEPWWEDSKLIPYGSQIADWMQGFLETGVDHVLEATGSEPEASKS